MPLSRKNNGKDGFMTEKELTGYLNEVILIFEAEVAAGGLTKK